MSELFVKTRYKRFISMCLVLMFVVFSAHIVLADEDDEGGQQKGIEIEKARYDSSDDELKVKVEINGYDDEKLTVVIIDAVTEEFIAQKSSKDEDVEFKIRPISGADVPCRIKAVAGNLFAEKNVRNAPADCSSSNPDKPLPGENLPPTCTITYPNANPLHVALGDDLTFSGNATDQEGGNLTYEWDFNGGADSRPTGSMVSPLTITTDPVTFEGSNGSFIVTLIVTDEGGLQCRATTEVIVGDPANGLPGPVAEQPAPGSQQAGGQNHSVLAFNDLGMHCQDLGSQPFTILPPFNTLNAVVIQKGSTGSNRPVILTDQDNIEIRYSAAINPNDPVGAASINSTGQNLRDENDTLLIRKTDYWDFVPTFGKSVVELLFGANLQPDENLQTLDNPDHGRRMPGINDPYLVNEPKPFGKYKDERNWFTAQGIPITNLDDRGRFNSYPLMRVQAVNKSTGNVLATVDAVTPVSSEVDCRDCHVLGEVGADQNARENGPVFVAPENADRLSVETSAKINILRLHDFNHSAQTGTLSDGPPVLCASCHQSNALVELGGPAGISDVASMSSVMHAYHGRLQVDGNNNLVRDNTTERNPVLFDPDNPVDSITPLIKFDGISNCFECHPGKITQCFRGVMKTAGLVCNDCHGDLLSVGGVFPLTDGTGDVNNIRIPWVNEPECGSCHTGNGSDDVLTVGFNPDDKAATPLAPASSRFAENPGTLYRNSLDSHAGIACEACHGSTHAIWPNKNPNHNDNIESIQLQGYAGTIMECSVCHTGNFNLTKSPNGNGLKGPHGMHPVNDPLWIKGGDAWHGSYAEDSNKAKRQGGIDQCAVCHGADHKGTRLSKVPVDRELRKKDGELLATLSAGDIVSCDLCHSLNKSFDD